MEVFDESSASGITFPLQNVIKGWTEGISFKEGGSGNITVSLRVWK
jgi:FKBP-type peptidyl-prolyl cis-trans isomerase FkpA